MKAKGWKSTPTVILNLFQDLSAWDLFLKGTKTITEIYARDPEINSG